MKFQYAVQFSEAVLKKDVGLLNLYHYDSQQELHSRLTAE